MQKANGGGVGLWNKNAPEEYRLTVYVTDFLLNAGDRGYEIATSALDCAIKRLNDYVHRPSRINVRYGDKEKARLSVQAYAAFVLAGIQQGSLGSMRTLFDNHKKDRISALPLIHLGIALSLKGDHRRADEAFDPALKTERTSDYYRDYGSPIRDFALSYYLLKTYATGYTHADQWLLKLHDGLYRRKWLNTQEQNALVLAGLALLKGTGQTWQAQIALGNATEKIESNQSILTADLCL